jgi:DNA-binding transcriptional LysR family regulator
VLDWDDVRYFLAVARRGSFSSAARALKVAQPTVGRRMSELERLLGAELFVRTPSGRTLTGMGRRMLERAERMEQDVLEIERTATGRDAGLRGRVRITASEWMIARVLGPTIGGFVARHPGLELELVAETRHVSLAQREADIAIRPSRFEHQGVVQREIAVVAFGLYASDAYLAHHGVPDFSAHGAGHVLIAMSESLGKIPDVAWLPEFAGRARVAVRTNGREPMMMLARAGVGLTCLPRFLGDAAPGLRLLQTPVPGPERKLWLGYHRDARGVPRVQAAARYLAENVARLRPALRPEP